MGLRQACLQTYETLSRAALADAASLPYKDYSITNLDLAVAHQDFPR
jgi:hypothetical protein